MTADTVVAVVLSRSMTTLIEAPRAARIALDQNISPNKAGIYIKPPTHDPYFSWNGSNIVT